MIIQFLVQFHKFYKTKPEIWQSKEDCRNLELVLLTDSLFFQFMEQNLKYWCSQGDPVDPLTTPLRETIMSGNYALKLINWYYSKTLNCRVAISKEISKIRYITGKLTHMVIFCVFSL